MNRTWLAHHHERDVVIFMLGWASTPNAVLHLHPPGCDVLVTHNYTEGIEPLHPEDFASYRRIYLVAWSFGVWVAEQCCRELPLYRAIALNGTPYPTDERYGMRLRATLRAIQAAVTSGHALPPRDPERAEPPGPFSEPTPTEKLSELTHLAEWSRRDSGAYLQWHAAYIADRDEIFPPGRMRAYWQSVGLGTEFSGYHYPFANPTLILKELEQ